MTRRTPPRRTRKPQVPDVLRKLPNCDMCHGSGICDWCRGCGMRPDLLHPRQMDLPMKYCEFCSGDVGRCRECRGTGEKGP